MSQALLGLRTTFRERENIFTFLFSSVLLFIGYFVFANFKSALLYFSYLTLPLSSQVKLFVVSFFDMGQFKEVQILFLVVGVSLVGGLVITLLTRYSKIRKEIITKSGLYSGIALMLAVLGVGCAACGAVLLSTIFSFIGLSSLLAYFPYHGVEVGYLGLCILLYLSYSLAVRLANPYTC